MGDFFIEQTKLKDIHFIHSFSSEDERGQVIKEFSDKYYAENGIEFSVIESLQIYSKKGTLRGLHIQKKEGQSKLIQCVFGKVCVVIVDLRKDSDQFGQSILFELNGLDGISVLVPPQFALGTLAMEDSIISCKCNKEYSSEFDEGILWNDKDLDIQWPIQNDVVVSKKDVSWASLIEYQKTL